MIASVRIHTLGGFRVTVGGRPLQFETRAHRKPLELLKVLIALGGENVSEIPLSEALWPDADGDAAHASFATTLHRLRRLIGSDTLHMRDKRLSLDPALCRVDAFAFERTMEQAAAAISSGDRASGSLLEEGLALYLGPFLEGEFEPPEILPARERYHGIFLRNVEEAGRAFQESGNFSQAIALYRKALEIDPHHAQGLWLAGSWAYLEGEMASARGYWERLLGLLPPDSPEAEVIRGNLAQVAQATTEG